jgi:hypothetical protein
MKNTEVKVKVTGKCKFEYNYVVGLKKYIFFIRIIYDFKF